MTLRLVGAVAILCACTVTAAEARKLPRHGLSASHTCVFDNNGRQVCREPEKRTGESRKALDANGGAVAIIPNPAGCPRVRFCACGLAKYWGLGQGLNLVATWPKVFPRAHGPAVGMAAVRRDRHHVLGIVGGGPGAWHVVDFNSGKHLSRSYVTADFRGYFFVDTRSRVASND